MISLLARQFWGRTSTSSCRCMALRPIAFKKQLIWLPYSGKILRAKIFEVDFPQNILRIKFQGSTRLSLHLYAVIRFLRINFRGSSEIHENSEIYCPRKFPLYGILSCTHVRKGIKWWFSTVYSNNLLLLLTKTSRFCKVC